MSDIIEKLSTEMTERIKELEPAVAEHAKLLAAKEALGNATAKPAAKRRAYKKRAAQAAS